ncbi:flagellar basal body rod protein FlgC [Piscinibacterium candidicorallinum]|jgi:flagellar basal-body rod protein FlgC|uniref:Flagellar basal-body rod protein FlgC n=1 Tax=Piscinibacterium candidicorallinum TaxID=1793872 RepID=A0ABV7H9B1_9BURK|nr:flagellar basal-body rod protein FlgC [beta proteobacterium AAP99]
MSLFRILDVSSSAVSAQSQRLNVTASNLANADSVAGPDGKPYKARQVVFQSALTQAQDAASVGVRVTSVNESEAEHKKIYDPKNALADEAGYVTGSNVNVIEEMVNMISAARSYENNIEVMNTARSLLNKTLQMGQ